jgi:glycine/D-amino acid oxidase-like deaminating enzyme
MVRLMNNSIDQLEQLARESNDIFRINRRGYLYATADPQRIPQFKAAAELAEQRGAGKARFNDYQPTPSIPVDGADVLLEQESIRRHFPYLSQDTLAVVHVRRAGWFSSTELGTYLLAQARAAGAQLVRGRVASVDTSDGRVRSVRLENGETIETDVLVNAAGPLVNEVAQMCGMELPVYCERHTKLGFHDTLGIVPRDAPMLIWADPQKLVWDDEEREMLAEADETRWMLDELPAGVHTRAEGHSGSDLLLMLWAYDAHPVPPKFPIEFEEAFPDVVLRGLSTMLPGLKAYFNRPSKPMVDGGYYIKTRENRPLIGALPVAGAYVIGALSGYGIMAAPAAGELLAQHILGDATPEYAQKFLLSRYEDEDYKKVLAEWGDTGQL